MVGPLLLLTLGFAAGGLVIQSHARGDSAAMWSRFDEANAHLPEIRRLQAGGRFISPTDTKLAMAPGLHWFYATFWPDKTPPEPGRLPWGLRLGNLLLAPLLALCAAGWFRAVAPRSSAWPAALVFALLLFSPYTMASGLYITTDNVGMALFFACGWALTRPGPREHFAAALLLPSAVVLVRHIYSPALLALPLWSWITGHLRRDAIVAAFVSVLAFAPFYVIWEGLTPPHFAAVHRTGVFVANIAAMCAFAAFLLILMAPMLDWGQVRERAGHRQLRRVVAYGASAGFALCVLAPDALAYDPARWQDGALLYLVDRLFAPYGVYGALVGGGLVVCGAIALALLAWVAWRDGERRYAAGLIALHLMALCFQERPYQRYFEAPLVLLAFMVLAPLMRARAVNAVPLVAVWLLQAGVYLKRLF